jgi:hypothetical protein
VFANWYATHQQRAVKDPQTAIADAVAMMERERTLHARRIRRFKRIAILIMATALAIALMIVISRYRQLAAQ